MNLTQSQIDILVDYLKDPARHVLVEAEMPDTSQNTFIAKYSALSGGHPLPGRSTEAPYYIWPQGTNKWGIELRLYFISDDDMPSFLTPPRCRNNNRHGYDQDKRINDNDLIYILISRGFVLGPQVPGRIK